jgi:hypothetical protein
MRLLRDKGRNILARLTSLSAGIKEVWEDMTAGELSENERTYIKTSAVVFLLFFYVWVTI